MKYAYYTHLSKTIPSTCWHASGRLRLEDNWMRQRPVTWEDCGQVTDANRIRGVIDLPVSHDPNALRYPKVDGAEARIV